MLLKMNAAQGGVRQRPIGLWVGERVYCELSCLCRIMVYAIFIFWKYDPVKSRALLAVSSCVSVRPRPAARRCHPPRSREPRRREPTCAASSASSDRLTSTSASSI